MGLNLLHGEEQFLCVVFSGDAGSAHLVGSLFQRFQRKG